MPLTPEDVQKKVFSTVRFKEGYDELLSSTGLADAATLAGRFGIDLRTEDFWRASLEIIRQDIDQFEELVRAGA